MGSRRVSLLAVLGLVAAVVVGVGTAPSAVATTSPRPPHTTRQETPGSQLWRRAVQDTGAILQVGPDGSTVYISGGVTIAYDAHSGAELWHRGFPGDARALAVSPDGSKVFVAGSGVETSPPEAGTWITIAYDASTGAVLWQHDYQGIRDGQWPVALGVSPDGSRVFVTGAVAHGPYQSDYATVAFDAATGTAIWERRYDGPADGSDSAAALGVSPDGSTVYVTGESFRTVVNGFNYNDYATIAYDAATGTQLWVSRYSASGSGNGGALRLEVSPVGTVFVTGDMQDSAGAIENEATVAYDPATGAQLWVNTYPGGGATYYPGLAVSPDGSLVFVTGSSWNPTSATYEASTVAYGAATGIQLWVSKLGNATTSSVGVSPDGSTVFVGASQWVGGSLSYDYVTLAYDAATGAELWMRLFGSASWVYYAELDALAVSPAGSAVFVTGRNHLRACDCYVEATIAYSTQ